MRRLSLLLVVALVAGAPFGCRKRERPARRAPRVKPDSNRPAQTPGRGRGPSPVAGKGDDGDTKAGAGVQPPSGWMIQKGTQKVVGPDGDRMEEVTFCVNKLGMEFVLIQGGPFADQGAENADERKPRGFFMAAQEVSQELYKKVMLDNPSQFRDDRNPVENVSWNDANEFCRRLSLRDELTYRLPTVAEWRYACGAGAATPFYTGHSLPASLANYDLGRVRVADGEDPAPKETKHVASFPPNAWGLYDMHGNVAEWCRDWHGAAELRRLFPSAPLDTKMRSFGVLLGGSYRVGPASCSITGFKLHYNPATPVRDGGFRVVLVLE